MRKREGTCDQTQQGASLQRISMSSNVFHHFRHFILQTQTRSIARLNKRITWMKIAVNGSCSSKHLASPTLSTWVFLLLCFCLPASPCGMFSVFVLFLPLFLVFFLIGTLLFGCTLSFCVATLCFWYGCCYFLDSGVLLSLVFWVFCLLGPHYYLMWQTYKHSESCTT